MNIPFVSIIIPVFNADKYINDCVNSIFQQTFSSWELILVDDGSLDDSARICDELSALDCRIRTFHNINAGASAARFFGVGKANGEYFCFVDADDSLPQDALECLCRNVNGVDIIAGGYCRIYDNQKKDYCRLFPKCISNEEYLLMLLSGNWKLYGPVAKLFKRTLFENEIPMISKEIRVGEDLLMNVFLALCAKRIKFISNIVYNYNQISTSATHTFKYTFEYMEVYLRKLDEILENGSAEKKELLLNHYKLSMTYNVILDDVNDNINYNSPFLEALCKLQISFSLKERLIMCLIHYRLLRIVYRVIMNSYRSGNPFFCFFAKFVLR